MTSGNNEIVQQSLYPLARLLTTRLDGFDLLIIRSFLSEWSIGLESEKKRFNRLANGLSELLEREIDEDD